MISPLLRADSFLPCGILIMIKLIVGLGNPGIDYDRTRHNAGFWFVDGLADRWLLSFRKETRFFGDHCRSTGSHAVSLLRPGTFMNLSGKSVAACANFYKYSANEILVVHDELDLDPGTIRIKQGGGHGGHNGLRDIIQHLDKDFYRLRVGIGHPGHASKVLSWVLSRASVDDDISIMSALDRGLDEINNIVGDKLQVAMTTLHTKNTAKR